MNISNGPGSGGNPFRPRTTSLLEPLRQDLLLKMREAYFFQSDGSMLICQEYGGEEEGSDWGEEGGQKGKDSELLSFRREKEMSDGSSLVPKGSVSGPRNNQGLRVQYLHCICRASGGISDQLLSAYGGAMSQTVNLRSSTQSRLLCCEICMAYENYICLCRHSPRMTVHLDGPRPSQKLRGSCHTCM